MKDPWPMVITLELDAHTAGRLAVCATCLDMSPKLALQTVVTKLLAEWSHDAESAGPEQIGTAEQLARMFEPAEHVFPIIPLTRRDWAALQRHVQAKLKGATEIGASIEAKRILEAWLEERTHPVPQ